MPAHQTIPAEHRGAEHLANERTFLAWVRTSIAVISLGFVMARFSLWLKELSAGVGGPPSPAWRTGVSMKMGEIMMVFGGILPILAAWRYHVVNRAIDRGAATVDKWLVVLVTVVVATLAAAISAYMLFTGK
jgi:putative membrane protein